VVWDREKRRDRWGLDVILSSSDLDLVSLWARSLVLVLIHVLLVLILILRVLMGKMLNA